MTSTCSLSSDTLPAPTTLLADYDAVVLENRWVGNNLFVLSLEARHPDTGTPFACLPGQFVMLDLPTQAFHFRRPFSVMAVSSKGTLEIFYKVVGRGTQMLSACQPHTMLRMLGPLGNSFCGTPVAETPDPKKVAMIGGGIGIAPLYCYGHQLSAWHQTPPKCLYGVRSEQDIGLLPELTAVFGDQLSLATNDGSAGFGGHVGAFLEATPTWLAGVETVLLCGPTVMMAAVTQWISEHFPAIKVLASLEEHMPCGTGACTGCVVQKTDQLLPAKVCVEGPIFDAKTIRWEGWQQNREATPCLP